MRIVQFTGKDTAPGLSSLGFLGLGEWGELAHLGLEATELKGVKARSKAAADAWLPVLQGKTFWRDVARS